MDSVIKIEDGVIKQRNQTVLKDVNVEIETNEIVYLIGRTGSGKSSLLKTLYGELHLDSGKGSVVGMDLTQLKRKDIPNLRRGIGIVFQDFQLLTDRSIEDNLHFVMKASGWKRKKDMKRRAQEVLELVGLVDKLKLMPHQLSGGEQQRIAIARALLNRPKLILADEPTGNLDPETSQEIMSLLVAVSKEEQSSILMATHDMDMIKQYSGKVYKVANGSINMINPNSLKVSNLF